MWVRLCCNPSAIVFLNPEPLTLISAHLAKILNLIPIFIQWNILLVHFLAQKPLIKVKGRLELFQKFIRFGRVILSQPGRSWQAFVDRGRILQSFRRARKCKFSRQKHRFFYNRAETDNLWLSKDYYESRIAFVESSWSSSLSHTDSDYCLIL